MVSYLCEVCTRDAEERVTVVANLNSIGVAQGMWENQVSLFLRLVEGMMLI